MCLSVASDDLALQNVSPICTHSRMRYGVGGNHAPDIAGFLLERGDSLLNAAIVLPTQSAPTTDIPLCCVPLFPSGG